MRLEYLCTRIFFIACVFSVFVPFRSSFAAETPLLQATAVYGVISTDPVYLAIAQEKGFFKKNGLDINLTHIPTNQAVRALVGGKIHFTTVGPQVVEASLSGADAVYIMGVINSFVLSLYAKPEIANVRALSGKTLGVTNKGTPTDFAARLILKQNGLVADSEVKFAYLKEIPALVAALKEGIIDGAMISAPSTLTARAEALDYTRKNRTEVLPVMSKFTKITDPAQLNEALDTYEKAWERLPMPSQAAIEAVLTSSENPKAKSARWDQFVDDRFVKELIAAGMFK